jgi:hypothetical protein
MEQFVPSYSNAGLRALPYKMEYRSAGTQDVLRRQAVVICPHPGPFLHKARYGNRLHNDKLIIGEL